MPSVAECKYDLPSSPSLPPKEKGARSLVPSPFGEGEGEGGFGRSYVNSATPAAFSLISLNERVETAMLMLVFYVGKNLYAIESARVVEVIPRVSYREVHHVPEYVAGVFNYRGSIVPVIDLCRLIRGTPSKGYLSTRVMMVSYPRPDSTPRYIGLMAERVIETLNKAETEFKDAGIQAHEAPYLGGIITDKKGMIQRIRLEQLFSDVQHINLLSAGV